MPMHSHLRDHLEPVARRQRRLQLWRRLALCWGTAAVLGLGVVGLHRAGIWTFSFSCDMAVHLFRSPRRRWARHGIPALPSAG